jgi:hypothetical protein
MEISNEDYVKSAQLSIRRLSKLIDYQEQHIEILQQELIEAREVISSLQENQGDGAEDGT